MSTWFNHAAIGLHPEGYGKLLGEVTWTCSRVGNTHHPLNSLWTDTYCPVAFGLVGCHVYEGQLFYSRSIEHAPIRVEGELHA